MNADSAEMSEAGALASLFDAAAAQSSARPWRDGDELGAVLRHQLAAPLSIDLVTIRGVSPEQVERLAAGAPPPPIQTFADLLHHPSPPLELLELTKRFAKRARAARGTSLTVPREVAAVLYFASIHVASARRATCISNLEASAIRAGAGWVLAQAWVDPATRALFDGTVG